MSKIDDKIINNIKVICLDMISKAGSGDAGIIFSSLNLFYNLFKNHLVFDPNNKNFINRDRIVVSSRLLPLLYTCQTLFYKDMVMEDLKEYKAFNSNVSGLSKKGFVDMGSIIKGDVISSSVGISLGEEYLKNLLKIENSKAKLIDFKTYCIVTLDELMSGISYEAMSFASSQDLKNLIFIVIKDEVGKDSSNKETFKDNLLDHFISLNFNVSIINDSTNSINGAIEDAKDSKKPSVIIIKSTYGKSSSIENSNKNYNIPLPNDELLNIKNKAGIVNPFIIDNQTYSEINKMISKRLGKYLINYQSEKQKLILDLKIKEIIDFLEKGKINLDFNSENIKINENYEEELLKSNNKILNVLASKSPFILCGSNDNFIYTLASINKSSILNKENRLGRNILFGNRILAMGGVSCGLASLGFKIFLSTPLINENFVEPFIKLSSINNLDVNYIFTNDSFLNTYENNEYNALNLIDNLRRIPNIIVYRPSDINEIIGVYDSICKLDYPSIIVLGNDITPRLKETNEKYVIAGAYRIIKEQEGDIDAILVASGSEVVYALKINQELKNYNINMRVVSLVSTNLFEKQSEKYQNILLPKDIKTFTLEFNSSYLDKYASNKECIFKINDFFVGGSKEEKLKYFALNMDALKAKIIEELKK